MSSLAERLGYGTEARLLIVNCDDLGSSHAANVAIADSMENGIATSATLMVPCPWAREAADSLRRSRHRRAPDTDLRISRLSLARADGGAFFA